MSYINQTIDINAFYFAGRAGRMFPRVVQLGDEQFTFQEGLQYLVKKGQHVVKFFDMTDGNKTYRIACENDVWTLIGTKGGR